MRTFNILVAASIVAASFVSACSGSSAGPGSTGFFCSTSVVGQKECYGYSNLTAAQQSGEQEVCTDTGGMIVDSCPTGYVGCCSTMTDGYTINECFYAGSAAGLKAACTGTWTGGGGSSDGGTEGGTTEGGTDSSLGDTSTSDTGTGPTDSGKKDTGDKDTGDFEEGSEDADASEDTGFDSGTDTGTIDLDGAVCAPVTLTGFTPTLNASALGAGACTTTMITNIVADCLSTTATSTTCTDLLTDNATKTCYTGCVATDWTAAASGTSFSSTPWGGIVYSLNPGETDFLNFGGCISAALPTNATVQKCATDTEESLECELAACLSSCSVASDGTTGQAALFTCLNDAAAGECSTYANAENTDCATLPSNATLTDCLNDIDIVSGSTDAGTTSIDTAITQYLDIVCTGSP
jgi:hypothetical protein